MIMHNKFISILLFGTDNSVVETLISQTLLCIHSEALVRFAGA